jgi:hypothetical protein
VAELLDRLGVPVAPIGLTVRPPRFFQRQAASVIGVSVRPLRFAHRPRGEVQPGSGGSRRDDCCGDSEDSASGGGCGLYGALSSIQVRGLDPQDHQSGDQ